MTDLIERTLYRLGEQLPGRVSKPGDDRYVAATAIWAKPIGRMPRAVVHCRSAKDVQSVVRAARDADLPLSVRAGGHDWAGRALCEGIVIDLSGMNSVTVDPGGHTARISGGARAADVVAATDPLGLAPVTGSLGMVGMAGLTLGGGYGPLIGRFGLALDNLFGAEVVLADARIVVADADHDDALLWALRGGGGNFGVVTAMRQRVHELPSVRFGVFIYPFAEAKSVLERWAAVMATVPDELTAQVMLAAGPDGLPAVMVAPMWCGPTEQGEGRLAPFSKLGTLVAGGAKAMPYGTSLSAFDPFIVHGRRTFIETCWLPSLDSGGIDIFIEAMKTAVSLGCALATHEFRGAASRVPVEATAFGLRRDHVLVEIIAVLPGQPEKHDEERHQQWAQATRDAFDALALPGGYPNLLARNDAERATKSFGPNAKRLTDAKQHYDPDNVFRSAIPLPSIRLAGSKSTDFQAPRRGQLC
jgi:FAD/FMN-containing dehydrogenase